MDPSISFIVPGICKLNSFVKANIKKKNVCDESKVKNEMFILGNFLFYKKIDVFKIYLLNTSNV